MDLSDPAIGDAFRAAGPGDIVIHAAAVARVDECRRDPDRARRVNVEGSRRLAERAADRGAHSCSFPRTLSSTASGDRYREADPPNPLTVYGQTKADAEAAVLAHPNSAVARLSLLFGPCLTDRTSFFDRMVDALRHSRPVPLFADEWRAPLAANGC